MTDRFVNIIIIAIGFGALIGSVVNASILILGMGNIEIYTKWLVLGMITATFFIVLGLLLEKRRKSQEIQSQGSVLQK